MPDAFQTIARFSERDGRFAVVTLLDSQGSTPAKIGSKAIVDPTGAITGTIGGGILEAVAQRKAVEAIQSAQPVVFDFSLEGPGPPRGDPICGGKLRVLVDPTAGQHRAAYALAAEAREQRKRGVLLTKVHTEGGAGSPQGGHTPSGRGSVSVQWLDESALAAHGDFPDADSLRAILQSEAAELRVQDLPQAGERLEVLVEAIVPKPLLLIVGGGHVGQAVALQAQLVGFDIAVLEDRQEFTRPGLFPAGTRFHCGGLAEEVARFPSTTDTYIVIVTRGHKCDAEALENCLRKPHAYLGMIGSRRKVTLVRQAFLESGRATSAEWEKLYTPIGLDIGALTVPEIATSIVAQLIGVRRKGSAGRMPA